MHGLALECSSACLCTYMRPMCKRSGVKPLSTANSEDNLLSFVLSVSIGSMALLSSLLLLCAVGVRMPAFSN
eukprot:478886-Amphidinium_carterae.1